MDHQRSTEKTGLALSKKYKSNIRTAPDTAGATKTFQIIHPFHPFFGRHFELVSTRWNWQQEWVYFHDDDGRLSSVPTDWTSLSAPDPFLVLSNGRARFRPDDLVRLADLIEGLWQG